MIDSLDLADGAAPQFVSVLRSTLTQPWHSAFSDMSARGGWPNGGLSITSGVIRARSAPAAIRLARDGALPLTQFNGAFRAVPHHFVAPPRCLGKYAVALTSDEIRGAEGAAVLWTRGDLVELLMVVEQRADHPERLLSSLAHRQNGLIASDG